MDIEHLLAAALAPRYELVREVGSGGMATVYLARDLEDAGLVAVKVLSPELSSGIAPARFHREMRIAAGLDHPRIVRLLDSRTSEGLICYVMPYVEGPSLRERIEAEGQLPVEEARTIVREVAEALDHAHERGIIHRDVKPGNILLSADGAHLADFGIASAVAGGDDERLTATGQTVGTAAYASPEQASGSTRVDRRTDVYSLGCVLYEMLSGEPPFTGATPQAVVARHLSQRAPTLDIVRPDLPPAVVAAVDRALSKAPADRFGSAGAFATALFADRPAPSPRARRRSWLRAGAAAALLVVAGLLARMLFFGGGPVSSTERVVVFPLAATSGVADPSAGWDVALALGAALEHAHPLRFVDGWTWLTEEQRSDPALVTASVAREVSRERGARYYIGGALRTSGDSLSVVLRLEDAVGDSLVAQETASGPSGAIAAPGLGMRALLRLLPLLVDPERPVDLTPLTERRPAASALFLQGERAYRQARFEEALSLYERAVEEDSLHAFAAIKGAEAADWASDFGGAEELVGLALRHDSLLPEKYRDLARGLAAYNEGDAPGALRAFGAALAVDDQWSEAETEMAEVYVHLLPPEPVDADSVARSWLDRARLHDPRFAPPLYHLAEIALRAGDVERARTLVGEWVPFEPDTVWLEQLRISLACLTEGPGAFSWSDEMADHARPVLQAGTSLARLAAQPACAMEAFRAVLGQDLPLTTWHALAAMGLSGLQVARGDYAAADSTLAAALAEGMVFAQMYFTYAQAAGAPYAARADSAEAMVRRAAGDAYDGFGAAYAQWSWMMAVRLVCRGDLERASAVADVLEAWDRAGEGHAAHVLARSLRAHVLAGQGRDSAALAILDELAPSGTRNSTLSSLWEPLGLERILRAELLLGQGRAAEAYRTAALLDYPAPLAYLFLLPGSLQLRARAAEAMGRPDLVRRARERLEALGWTDPDHPPPLPLGGSSWKSPGSPS